jgi:hypothetical protein
MDLASPAASWALFWTITRAVALAVLATEAVFVVLRARSHKEQAPVSRVVWAATPAVLLAGLALWCLMALPGPRSAPPDAIALATSSTALHR